MARLFMAATVATFAYDALDDAAISVFVPVTYARFILHREGESLLVRLLLAVALGLLAAWRFSFDHAGWADAAGLLLLHCITIARLDRIIARASNLPRPTLLQCGALGAAVLVGPWLARHLLPIDELALAYTVGRRFAGPAMDGAAARLALITVSAQVPLGYLGIAYLRVAQQRKNSLLKVGSGGESGGGSEGGGAGESESARSSDGVGSSKGDRRPAGQLRANAFMRSVGVFILCTAVPYFLQRTIVESVNAHASVHLSLMTLMTRMPQFT